MSFKLMITAAVSALLCVLVCQPDPPLVAEVEELSKPIQDWHRRGKSAKINGYDVFYIYEKCKNKKISDPETFVILHGFPSSSYEYHKVIDSLLSFGNVFVHDQVGFGLSDKPKDNYTYSLSEAAENTLILWRNMNITSAHVISHDMGDSIFTEMLARRYRGMLPDYFKDFFKSATFTNGGMKYSLINFRLSQILLPNPTIGPVFSALATKFGISTFFATAQLRSIWAPNANKAERDLDIENIIELHHFKGGTRISHKQMYYLWDRAHFEFRWFAALSKIDIPVRFVWGDSDEVAPICIPKVFQTFVTNMELTTVRGAGHFLMLEKPEEWVNEMKKILEP